MINVQELRETLGGGSFLKKFFQCERSFYYRYIEGLMPMKTAEALIYGSAFHETAAKFWEGKSLDECIDHGIAVLDETGKLLEENKLNLLKLKLNCSFPELHTVLLDLQNDYEYIEHEATAIVHLLTGDLAFKPDIVLRHKRTGKIEIFDYKTTGSNIGAQVDGCYYSRQPRLYSYGIKLKYELDYYPIWNTIEIYARKVARKDEFSVNIQISPITMNVLNITDVITAYTKLLGNLRETYKGYKESGNIGCFAKLGECDKCSFKDICLERVTNAFIDDLEYFDRDPWVVEGLVDEYLVTGLLKEDKDD